jgi:hypothetical protein
MRNGGTAPSHRDGVDVGAVTAIDHDGNGITLLGLCQPLHRT